MALKWVLFLAILASLALVGLGWLQDSGRVHVLSGTADGMAYVAVLVVLLLGTTVFTLAYLLTVIFTRRRYVHRGIVHYTALVLGLLLSVYVVAGWAFLWFVE
ncbi:hypothetical protein [Arthrobacter antioxidans]|uniref:hypothetical protein n=1 Tax=Arthrobacter antioxidans TaxID=2895818 RepID=UPI001FFE4FE2|nr:hypothetical protein [Arthrobacter antioxidans]